MFMTTIRLETHYKQSNTPESFCQENCNKWTRHSVLVNHGIRVAHSPPNWKVDDAHDFIESFDDNYKWMFSVPYHAQKSDSWLRNKQDHIGGSEVGDALGVGHQYNERAFKNSTHQYVMVKCNLAPKKGDTPATMHGNLSEPKAAHLYCQESNQVLLEMGFLEDRTHRYLGVSPDSVTIGSRRAVEYKCPFERLIFSITDHVQSGHEIPEDVVMLSREIVVSGNARKYLAMTNLPVKYTRLMDNLICYWHQCMMQAHVLRLFNDVHFVQYGTAPNRHYLEEDFFSITSVPVDINWMNDNEYKLRKVWDLVEKKREENPDWRNKIWSDTEVTDWNERVFLVHNNRMLTNMITKKYTTAGHGNEITVKRMMTIEDAEHSPYGKLTEESTKNSVVNGLSRTALGKLNECKRIKTNDSEIKVLSDD